MLVNSRVSKASSRAVVGDRITLLLPPPAPIQAQPEHVPLHILYEDRFLLVVNKPAGMVVHPAPGNATGTLVNALLGRYAHLPGDPQRPGIVHRLDKDTSGLIVVARTPQAIAALSDAFRNREVHKEYLALIQGTMRPDSGVMSGSIGRDPRHRQRMALVANGGREASTRYQTDEVYLSYSLVRLWPKTGRMHQIRVHLSTAGHPVAGDPIYGRPEQKLGLTRLFLHATRLRFRHPETGMEIDLQTDLPDDLTRIITLLRSRS